MIPTLSRLTAFNCRETVRCEAPRCSQRTRDGKPYCPEHVELLPYVQELQAALAEQQAEQRRVASRGARAVDPDGLTARELLLQLDLYGDRTVERLARDLQLDVDLVHAYAKALARHGRVSLSQTRRGHVSLHAGPGLLVEPAAASEELSASTEEELSAA